MATGKDGKQNGTTPSADGAPEGQQSPGASPPLQTSPPTNRTSRRVLSDEEVAQRIKEKREYQAEARKKYDHKKWAQNLVDNLNRRVLREAEEDAKRLEEAKVDAGDLPKPVSWIFVLVDHDLVAIARWASGQNAWKLVDGKWQELHGDALGVAIFEGHVCPRPDDLPPLPEMPARSGQS